MHVYKYSKKSKNILEVFEYIEKKQDIVRSTSRCLGVGGLNSLISNDASLSPPLPLAAPPASLDPA